MRKYIITGGPGSGKTNVLEALKSLGYSCSDEISRSLIIQEVEKKTDCLPWVDLNCFADKVLGEMILAHKATLADQLTFYDRGLPDIIAYLKVAGLPVPDNYYDALQQNPYHKTVFILPPWQEIYITDSERWQTYQEAEELYWGITDTYKSLGFDLIGIPKFAVKHRANYIINYINNQ
ncbi:MAG: putative ATPase [Mucilaginibacter sp.]|jgi:predicted ATPase|nr:putative ATPase [Mucilaginibacter sp.]